MAIALDNNFNETPAEEHKPFVRPPSGGYVWRVVKSEEANARATGAAMVVWSLDIHEGPHKGAFTKYPIKFYQLTGGENLGRFKGALKAFNESNNPQKMQAIIQQGVFYPERMEGMLVGGCLRDEEYLNKFNQVKVKGSIAFLCAASKAKSGEIQPMAVKTLEPNKGPSGAATGNPPPHGDDDLPNW